MRAAVVILYLQESKKSSKQSRQRNLWFAEAAKGSV